MGDICRIDISTLKSYKNDFNNEKDNFNNNIYSTFSNSYLNTCSNSYVSRIANSLQPFYEKINNGYDNIDKWWTSYNENIEGLESYLADSGSVGAITESSVRSSAIKLPELRKYSTNDLEGIITPYYASITEAGGFTFDTIDIVLDYSINEVTSLTANIISWTQNVNEWWEKDALPFIKEAATVIWDVLKSVGATIVTVVQSLVEGLLQFVEALVDFVALAAAVVTTPQFFIGDIIFSVLGEVLGFEWEWKTKAMWDAVMGFVSTKYVTGWFDQLYENTEYGKWLVENTWGFETVRSIGNGVGYIAGVVALTIATFGAGGVVVSGGAATTSAAVGAGSAALSGGAVTASAAAGTSVATNAMAVIAGVAGVGKGTQDAWADGAGLAEGLLAGTFQGVWEGLQFFIGGKISGLKLFGTDGVLKTVGTKEINTKLLNSFGRVVLDGADGGVEGFVTPLIESIYKDGYKDENGNYVEFSEDSNFFERYNELFDDNGGWENVLTQAFIGSASSLLGEAFDLGKHFENKNIKNVNIDEIEVKKSVKLSTDSSIPNAISSFSNDGKLVSSIDIDKLENAINTCKAKFGTDEAMRRINALVDPNSQYYGNFDIITRMNGARDVFKSYTLEQIDYILEKIRGNVSSKTNKSSIHSFFDKIDQYGADQADVENLCVYIYNGKSYEYRKAKRIANEAIENNKALPKFNKKGTDEYFRLKNKLIDKGFKDSDASIILTSINDKGACSYASVCNEIFYQFRDNPDLFEKKFGYPMYKKVGDKVYLNSEELLTDLYVYANDKKNGGNFFENGQINTQYLSNKIDVFGRNILKSENQQYMSSVRGKEVDVIDGFLKSKSPDLEFDSQVFINNFWDKIVYPKEARENIINKLEKEIENGKSVSMGIYYDKKQNDKVIHMLSYDETSYKSISTNMWDEGFGHSVTVTGITNDGLCVSSWGKKYLIPYDDLFAGGKFLITVDSIKTNVGGINGN